jgi:hemerythrin-like metal-binding protein
MQIAWKPEFSIGVESIDQQHRQLLAIINDLNRPDDQVEFLAVTVKIKRYVEQHFAYEEELMVKYGYSKTKEHAAEHTKLKEQFAAFVAGPMDAQSVGRTRMLIYNWFIGHVVHDGMDRHLGDFLKRIGVFPAVRRLS